MLQKIVSLLLILMVVSSCTWVKPTREGLAIRVVENSNQITSCVDMRRTITVSVKDSVAGVPRDTLKVQDELELLARNEAARVAGADTVYPAAPVQNGEQTFLVFDCH